MAAASGLQGKSAIVTGASRGIGLATARLFAAEGAHVVLVGRDATRLDEAAASIGAQAVAIAGSVEDPDTIARATDAALTANGRIDILINNAGGPPADGPLVAIPMADFDAAISLNLRAPLLWTRAAWSRSMCVHGGAIVNIASIGGLSAPRAMGAYATAKAGLLHMTRMLAAELGPSIRVNAIAPGVVRTDATAAVDYDGFARILPMGRVGEPDDIAAAALFLAGARSGWITGETITIDGGTLIQTGRLKRGWQDSYTEDTD
jgi:NAD(P)-dependent dehydrogenase (short-subunit alcohol dehydrogenase family)